MELRERLIGVWALVSWHSTLDGEFHGYPFGREAHGRLTYNANGTMSAILMKPDRRSFGDASLARGSAAELEEAARGYVSYAGRFSIIGDEVHHHVDLSLLPNWIGTTLVRRISWTEDVPARLCLSTRPERTGSGRLVANHLVWQRLSTTGA